MSLKPNMHPQPAVDTVVSYKLRVKEEGKEYEEKITIDKDKQTETFHVDAHGQSEEADLISDFKQVRIFPLESFDHIYN